MKTIKYLGGPAIIALLAFICQAVDQVLAPQMPIGTTGGWIAFQAWAMYFVAGCTPKGGLKVFAAYIVGIVASIAIISLGSALPSLGFLAFPIAVFIIVIPTIWTEKVELLSLTPAIFVAAGVFFGIMNYVPNATFATATILEVVYLILGLALGYFTILLRGAYDAKFNK